MSIDEQIRKIVVEELEKRLTPELIPVPEYCRKNNIHRSTVWRAEKEGKVKLYRVGKKVFINPQLLIV